MKNNKGITLIALVITIIVLLILAGVSISMVLGENGIVSRATNAAEETSDADVKTALEVAVSGLQGDFIGIWNEDNTLVFLDCLKAGDKKPTEKNKIWLHADGYKIKLGEGPEEEYKEDATTPRKITGCKIQKLDKNNNGIGAVYIFDLVEKSRYGADVDSFARTDEKEIEDSTPSPEGP